VCFSGADKVQTCAQAPSITAGTWFEMELESTQGLAKASINGAAVLSQLPVPVSSPGASWPGLMSSFDAVAFRNLCITTNE
jgi:hypothetical protein